MPAKKTTTTKKKVAPEKKVAAKNKVTSRRTTGIKRVAHTKTYKKKANGKAATGRKEFKPTDEQRQMVATLSACGFTQEDLCKLIESNINGAHKLDDKTLRKYFGDELITGKVKAGAKVAARLYSEAVNPRGNISAAIFYLRTQMKWNTRVELTDPDGSAVGTSFANILKDALLASGDLDIDELNEANDGD